MGASTKQHDNKVAEPDARVLASVKKSTNESGVPLKVQDAATIAKLVQMVRLAIRS